MSKNILVKNKTINTKRIVAIIDATLGNLLFSKNSGKIMIDAAIAIIKGYRNPDQKDSFQISTFPTPRKTQSNNNMPQAMIVPCFALDFLKS